MKNKQNAGALLKMTVSMLIFGSIGLVARGIALPSAVIALARGAVGTVFLLIAGLFLRKKISLSAWEKNALPLIISGAAIGFNWIFLFESYRYTTIATATVCYYTAPVIVVMLSPLVLKERLSPLRMACVAVSLIGIVLVAGDQSIGSGTQNLYGIGFGLGAALFYSVIMLSNKFLKEIDSMDSTVAQLGIAAVVLLPYVLLTGQTADLSFNTTTLCLLLIAGIVHTGIGYLLYFSAMQGLSAQSIALCSYIDPVSAVIFSAVLLSEPMGALQIVGAVMILGAAICSQWKAGIGKETKTV